jgi:glucokinase
MILQIPSSLTLPDKAKVISQEKLGFSKSQGKAEEQKETFAIGVDLGGSHVSLGLVDSSGNVHDFKELKINNFDPPEKILNLIMEHAQILAQKKNVCAMGIGMPGRHDPKNKVCIYAPQLPKWKNVKVVNYLSKALKLPVYMMNDVRMATLGEYYFGEGKGTKNMIMIAIGTGIGGGIISEGKLLRGSKGQAGEIGHMIIEPHGPQCRCGGRGCLEALASGPAIAGRAASAVIAREPSLLQERVKSLEHINAKVVSDAAKEGDAVALRIMREAGQAIGIAITGLALAFNPEKVVIGGGVSLSGEPLFAPIRKEVKERMHMNSPKDFSIVPAKLGTKAGLIGAGAYALLKSGTQLPV